MDMFLDRMIHLTSLSRQNRILWGLVYMDVVEKGSWFLTKIVLADSLVLATVVVEPVSKLYHLKPAFWEHCFSTYGQSFLTVISKNTGRLMKLTTTDALFWIHILVITLKSRERRHQIGHDCQALLIFHSRESDSTSSWMKKTTLGSYSNCRLLGSCR